MSPLRASSPPRVEIFSRHAFFSTVSAHKKRPAHFTREKCFQNLLATTDFSKAHLHILFDLARGPREKHFLHRETRFPIVEFAGGTESASFLFLLDYVTKLSLDPETILYFVEDDYFHRPGWLDLLLEGFSLPKADYITLYDHPDKYLLPQQSEVFTTDSCHWRTTPSTTNTFAVRLQTLLADLPIHRKFSLNCDISQDHKKFLALGKKGRTLLSSIPGGSTHAEPDFISPCISWELFLH
ncbi:MAG: hypothetical protein KGI80_00790 [Verrucomicrobiota bacterium]|nr:hypothetical protein [Verrucomicrobiota bacterium]